MSLSFRWFSGMSPFPVNLLDKKKIGETSLPYFPCLVIRQLSTSLTKQSPSKNVIFLLLLSLLLLFLYYNYQYCFICSIPKYSPSPSPSISSLHQRTPVSPTRAARGPRLHAVSLSLRRSPHGRYDDGSTWKYGLGSPRPGRWSGITARDLW